MSQSRNDNFKINVKMLNHNKKHQFVSYKLE